MVGDEVDRRDAFIFHIVYRHIEKLTRDSLTAVILLGVYGADIWREVFSLVKIVLYYAESADYSLTVKAEIPAVFGVAVQVGGHTFEVRLGGHTPFTAEPLGGEEHQVVLFS